MHELRAVRHVKVVLVATLVVLAAGGLIAGRHMALFGQTAKTKPKASTVQTLGFSGGLAISPDGKTVAAGQDSRVCIWDVKSGKLLSTLTGHTAPVSAVVYGPDGSTLYSGGLDGSVVAWNIAAGGTPQELKGQSAVVGLAISGDGHSLFVRTEKQALQTYDLSSGLLQSETKLDSGGGYADLK